MIITLEKLLSESELAQITQTLATQDFVDGKATAGWHAKTVKNNTQLKARATVMESMTQQIQEALNQHPLFQAAARPRRVHSILFSRYTQGMSYGSHVDNALMGYPNPYRSDVSFTVFLTAPDSYDGGELLIEASDGDRAYKLAAGDALMYPSSTLHQVKLVTRGERLVCVGWVQSLVRDPAQRELLFDLDTARRSLFKQHGKTIEFDLISKSLTNLLRQWSD